MQRRWWLAFGVILLGPAIYFAGFGVWARKIQPRPAGRAVAEYVSPNLCAGCHPKISQSYSRTGMGRSFAAPTRANTFEGAASYYHAASQSHFTMLERDGKFFQRRHQIGFDGKPANIEEKEIHFVMGSGNHVRTFLHRSSANRLVELPLAWYSENGGSWAMNPGYDRPDHQGFRRAISNECMFCHNGYPDIPPGIDRPGEDARFPGPVPAGIDCQRCHGPGGRHVRLAQGPTAKPADVRAAIVNPSRLTAERQMEVCMQCHLETTSFPLPNAIVRSERGPFSYVPGEPLGDFKLFFDNAPGRGRDDKLEIVNAAYRLRKSACFQKSAGTLLCTSCHNPHEVSRGEDAAKRFVAVCRQCHAAPLDQLVSAGRHPSSNDCLGCHMPKRRTDDVVHAVVTDHFIQRRKPGRDLLAPLAERHETDATAYRGEVLLYYPQTAPELYLALAQVIQKSNLTAGIARLAAAIEKYRPNNGAFHLHLGDAWQNSGRLDKALPLFEEAIRREPKLVVAWWKFGAGLRRARETERAAAVLKQATALAPDRAEIWYELGMTSLDEGKVAEAIPAFQKATELDPDMPEAHNSLGGAWFVRGEAAKAEPEFRTAIRIRPDYAEAHNNLAGLLSAASDLRQACFHYEAALRAQPNYAAARYNYGLTLARMRRFDEAQPQITAALRIDPTNAEAHQVLGALLAGKGQRDEALRHYREALRIKPDFGRALVGLGSELAKSGDRQGAATYLEKAASGTDPAIRQQALELLRQFGIRR